MSDLTPRDHLHRFLKTRGDLNGEDSVFWWKGNIYSFIPGQASKKLFQFEGYNISRIEEIEGGYRMITREASFYKDPESGDILEHWHNPLNGRDVEVVHVWNDPVNQVMMEHSEQRGAFMMPTEDLQNGMSCLYFDVLLAYPSPLPRAEYPLYSQADLYQGGELFQFFVSNDELEDTSLTSIACSNSWTRVASWVPFMEMGDHAGNLLYQCRGSKLGGFETLPQYMQDYVMAKQPKYAEAPKEFVQPNETSWTYFKKHLADRSAKV
ncbi:MAG: DUF1838 family protein [Aggregatilineales bacterium]